jgi:hypothetical protein
MVTTRRAPLHISRTNAQEGLIRAQPGPDILTLKGAKHRDGSRGPKITNMGNQRGMGQLDSNRREGRRTKRSASHLGPLGRASTSCRHVMQLVLCSPPAAGRVAQYRKSTQRNASRLPTAEAEHRQARPTGASPAQPDLLAYLHTSFNILNQ